MPFRVLLAAALVAGAASPVFAQPPLTLSEAVRSALAQNAALRASASAAAEARHHASEARAALLPRVVFSESWQRSNAPVFAFSSLLSARTFTAEHLALTSLNQPKPVGLFRAAIGLEQQWFDGGGRRSAARQADLAASVADAERDEAAAVLVTDVTRTFGEVVRAEAGARAARSAHEAAVEDLARAQRRRDLGLSTEADVLAVSVHAAGLKQRVIELSGEASAASAALNRLMGRPVTDTVAVVEPLDTAVASDEPALDALLAGADTRRAALRRASLEAQLADAEKSRARAGLLPVLSTQVLVDLNGTRFEDRASAWMAGGELRWTFSLGGAEIAALKASAERTARARARAEDARAAVHVEIVTAYRRLESARARLAAGRTAVDEAHERQRIVRDRFDAGLATTNDVLQASAAVLSAESNRTAAMVEALVSRAELGRAAGRVLQ